MPEFRHTRQTIDLDDDHYVEVEEDGTVKFFFHNGEEDTQLFKTNTEAINRLNRILFSGRITPEGHESNGFQRKRFNSR